MFYFIL